MWRVASSLTRAASLPSTTDFPARKHSENVSEPTENKLSYFIIGSQGEIFLKNIFLFFVFVTESSSKAGVITVVKPSYQNLDQNLVLLILVSFALGAKWPIISQISALMLRKKTIFVIWVCIKRLSFPLPGSSNFHAKDHSNQA